MFFLVELLSSVVSWLRRLWGESKWRQLLLLQVDTISLHRATMVSFTSLTVALLGLHALDQAQAFAPKSQGKAPASAALSMVRLPSIHKTTVDSSWNGSAQNLIGHGNKTTNYLVFYAPLAGMHTLVLTQNCFCILPCNLSISRSTNPYVS